MVKRGLFWGTVFCMLAVLGLAAPNDEAGAKDKKPIGKVSMFEINDLSGPTSDATIPHHNGIRDVIKYTNDKGGILYKDPKTGQEEFVTIQFKFADNKASPGPVPTQYERLMCMDPKPVLYMPGSSGAAEPSAKWIGRDEVVAYGFPAGWKTWHPTGWYFCIYPDYPAQACIAAEYAMAEWRKAGHKEAPKWAWFTLDLPFGRAPISDESENYIKGLGFDIVGLWTIPFAPVDISAELMAMKAKGVNYFYGNIITLQTQAVVKTLHRLGISNQMMLCNIGGPIEELVEVAGKEPCEGLRGIRYLGYLNDTEKPGIKFAQKMAKDNKRFFGTHYFSGVGLGMLAVDTLKAAHEKYGFPITGAQLKSVWERPEGWDTGGIFPHLEFTAQEHRGVKAAHMSGIKDGKVVRISQDIELPDMRPGGKYSPGK